MSASEDAGPPPLVITPLDAGADVAPKVAPARRWLEVQTFDVVGTGMYLHVSDGIQACFDRAAPDRGYVMLLAEGDAGTKWSVEDVKGISAPAVTCLIDALAKNPARYENERPHRVYVVFR